MKLSQICEIVRGSSPRPKGDTRYFGGDFPRLLIADITRDGMYVTPKIDFLTEEGVGKSRLMKKGDLVVAVSGDPGRPSILNVDACIHDGFVGLRNLNKSYISTELLYYFFKYQKARNKGKAEGAIFKNLTTAHIKNIEIPAISADNQLKIVTFLTKAEKLISQRHLSIALLDELVESAFLEKFGDPILNPKRFPKKKLGDKNLILKVGSGSTPKGGARVYEKKGNIKFLRSQNIQMNRIDFDSALFLTTKIHQIMKNSWLKKNDVLLNITGASIGRVACYLGDDDKANVNQHVCIIRPNLKKLSPIYLSHCLSQKNFQLKIFSQNEGGTRQALNFSQIRNLIIPIPKIELQERFAVLVERVEIIRSFYEKSIIFLEDLLEILMYNSFYGHLTFGGEKTNKLLYESLIKFFEGYSVDQFEDILEKNHEVFQKLADKVDSHLKKEYGQKVFDFSDLNKEIRKMVETDSSLELYEVLSYYLYTSLINKTLLQKFNPRSKKLQLKMA